MDPEGTWGKFEVSNRRQVTYDLVPVVQTSSFKVRSSEQSRSLSEFTRSQFGSG